MLSHALGMCASIHKYNIMETDSVEIITMIINTRETDNTMSEEHLNNCACPDKLHDVSL